MSKAIRRFFVERHGASAVEFALVAPVFLLLLLGIIELSRLVWTSHALHETAIATARCMAIPQFECEDGGVYDQKRSMSFARAQAAVWIIDLDPADITLARNVSCSGLEGFSKATIEYRFETVIPELLTSLAGGSRLKAEACHADN